MFPSPTIRMPNPNRILAAVRPSEFRQLQPDLEPVTLVFGEVLCEAGMVLQQVYFPCSSLISLLTVVDGHHALEVGMVGCEGMMGVGYALGVPESPLKAIVQGGGSAFRMDVAPFRKAFHECPTLQAAVALYTHALITQISQTAACNRFHTIEARLARWLLMTRDRLGSNQFHLTHEFLANMLGVRRVGVTEAAHGLKVRKLIDYSRGEIDLVNAAGLEGVACSCYVREPHCHVQA